MVQRAARGPVAEFQIRVLTRQAAEGEDLDAGAPGYGVREVLAMRAGDLRDGPQHRCHGQRKIEGEPGQPYQSGDRSTGRHEQFLAPKSWRARNARVETKRRKAITTPQRSFDDMMQPGRQTARHQ